MLDKFAKERYEIASSLLDEIGGEEIRTLLLEITIEASKKNLKNIEDVEVDSYDAETLKRLAESLLFRIIFDRSLKSNEIEAAALVCAYAYETLCPPLMGDKVKIGIDDLEFLNRFISAVLYYISGYDPNAEAIISPLGQIINVLNEENSTEDIVLKQLYNFTLLKMPRVFVETKAPQISIVESFESMEENCRKACLWNLNVCLNLLSNEYCHIHDKWEEDISSKLYDLYLNSSDCNQQTISLISLLLILFEGMTKERAISILKSPAHCDPIIWERHMKRYIDEGVYLIWPPHRDAILKGMLELNHNNIVAIPTGTGKSLIAEHKIISYLQQGSVIIYLAPTLALCRQITKRMNKIMNIHRGGKGNSVLVDDVDVLREGTIDKNEDMILVMTPEKCVSLIANNAELVSKCSLCIVDEFHNIFQGSRGALLDLLISRIAQLSGTTFLIMSALIDDSSELKDWLKKLSNNDLAITNIKWRPARTLRGFISHSEKEIRQAKIEAEKSGKQKYKTQLSAQLYFCVQDVWLDNKRQAYPLDLPIKMNVRLKKINRNYGDTWVMEGYGNDVSRQLGNYLAASNMAVVIFSQGTRHLLSEIDKHKKIDVFPQSLTEETKAYLMLANEELGFLSELNSGLVNGIGIHTQAIIDEEQLAVESFFKTSVNGVLCATGTISQGLNLSASAVIVNTTKQYSEQETKPLSKAEVINMLGRAGRPGFGQQSLGIIVPQYPSTTTDKEFYLDQDSTSYLERVDGVEKTTSGLLNIINEIAEKELYEEGIDDDFTLMTNVLGTQPKPLRRDLLKKTLATQFLEDEIFDHVIKKWDSWLDTITTDEKDFILKVAVKSANKASVIEVILQTVDSEATKSLFENKSNNEVWIEWLFDCISQLDNNFIQQNIHELFTSNEVMIKFLKGWIAGSSILDLARILNRYNIGTLNEEKLGRSDKTSIAKAIKIIKEGIRNVSHIATAYISIVELIINEGAILNKLPEDLVLLPSYLRNGVYNEMALKLRKLGIPRKISIELSKKNHENKNVGSLLKKWIDRGEIEGVDKNIEKALLTVLK
ncbi:hypothetical protein CN268_21195 [Bacillus anthracis]|uniref:DEAD/DEAH box helicase n=1 Tax=Bacillus cereus group TaxID=86661 RepID=UPI000BF4C411|nr:DEAD/DEAH box helicase [Bacillus tropicus]PFB58665.1 hypothetical protein CN268_21195 [Bacillus anthracis]